MKVALRLLHFLLYLYVYLKAVVSHRFRTWTRNLRYMILWALHSFSDSSIVEAYAARMTKKSSHSAIVLNHVSSPDGGDTGEGLPREEIVKLSEIVAWMVLTGSRQVSLFDEAGLLSKEQEFIQSEVVRRLTTPNGSRKATVRKPEEKSQHKRR